MKSILNSIAIMSFIACLSVLIVGFFSTHLIYMLKAIIVGLIWLLTYMALKAIRED